jgi:hypothetical protein
MTAEFLPIRIAECKSMEALATFSTIQQFVCQESIKSIHSLKNRQLLKAIVLIRHGALPGVLNK